MTKDNMTKDNMKYSENLCEALNKQVNSESIIYFPCATCESFGVRQILDKRGLAYNESYFKDKMMNEYSLSEIADMILEIFDKGECKTVFPTRKAIELYDKLKINGWLEEGIRIEEGDFYIKEEAWSSIDMVELIKINRDAIELITNDDIDEEVLKITIKRGLEVNIEKVKMIPFNIIFNDEEEEKFVRYISIDEIVFRTSIGKMYSNNGKLYYNDELGDDAVCDLDKLTKITYVANKNAYMAEVTVEENLIEYVHFSQYGLEM